MLNIFKNEYLIIPIVIWFFVQSFKVIYDLIVDRKLNLKRMVGSGGMPSSHSALVCSLTTIVGVRNGVESPLFAISLIFAAIVMYDAAGVRRAAGKQARILNQIIMSEGKKINIQEKLIELIGHTPLEVIVGGIVGVIVSLMLL
jgi:acid phosphatase family membrane protein YuiD